MTLALLMSSTHIPPLVKVAALTVLRTALTVLRTALEVDV
jgi:hypothetical protein